MVLFDPQALRLRLASDASPWGVGLQRLAPFGQGVARWCERPRTIPGRARAALIGAVLAIVALRGALTGTSPAPRDLDTDCLVRPALSDVTAGFERNVGQAARDVRFLAQVQGIRVLVTRDELRLVPGAAQHPSVRLRLEGADPRSRLRVDDELPEERQYRMSPLDEAIVTVPAFGRVEYRDLYPGVDLALSLAPGALQLRFRVDRGASAAPIRVSIDRAVPTRDGSGVALGPSGLRINDAAVQAYPADGAVQPPVPVSLVVNADRSIGLELGAHDVRRAVDVVLAIQSVPAAARGASPQTLAMAQ